jgi:hypothetical protein
MGQKIKKNSIDPFNYCIKNILITQKLLEFSSIFWDKTESKVEKSFMLLESEIDKLLITFTK